MSLAAESIADLDEEIADEGQTVTLRRGPAAAPSALAEGIPAFVRGYTPDELEGGLQQGDSLVVFSPTHLPPAFSGANLLRQNDRIVISGRTRNVQFVDPVAIGDTLVRLNVQVRG